MSKLLSVSLSDELSRSTDDLAAAQGRTRSEVVRDALRSYLWRERWRDATREAGAMAESKGIGADDVERLVDELRADD
jgi:predicted transcriptional regulator